MGSRERPDVAAFSFRKREAAARCDVDHAAIPGPGEAARNVRLDVDVHDLVIPVALRRELACNPLPSIHTELLTLGLGWRKDLFVCNLDQFVS